MDIPMEGSPPPHHGDQTVLPVSNAQATSTIERIGMLISKAA